VHTAGTGDVTQEASNAEAHVCRVTQESQQNSRNTYDSATQDNQPIYFFQDKSPLFFIICQFDTIIITTI
jgi:hypothetical protein